MDNNYNDNPFEPKREYDFYDEIAVRDARRAVSKTALGLLLFTAVSLVALMLIYVILNAILGNDNFIALADSPYFYLPMGTFFMYGVGLPLLWICIKGLPVRRTGYKNTIKPIELVLIVPVAQFAMNLGANIGLYFDEIASFLFGVTTSNPVDDMVSGVPIWLTLLVTVVVGPVVEEFIFRKLLMDRLSVHGNVFAIVLTSILFGLFHGNFYQMFYAAALGFVLGYVTVKSGSWLYAAALHMLINFFNGALPEILGAQIEDFFVAFEAYIMGDAATFTENLGAFMVGGSFIILQSVLSLIGAVVFIYALVKKHIHVNNAPECAIPKGRMASVIFSGGMIAFLVWIAFEVLLEYVPLLAMIL